MADLMSRSGKFWGLLLGAMALLAVFGAGAYMFIVPEADDTAPAPMASNQANQAAPRVPVTGGSQVALPPKPAAQRPMAPVPQPIAEPFGSWRVQCRLDMQSREACRIEQILRDEGGQSQLAVVIRPASAAIPGRITVLPPWGILIQPGLVVRVDNSQPLPLPIGSCQASGCEADLTLNEGLLQAMRKGTSLRIGMTTSDGKAAAATVPLAGFADAYDRATQKAAR